MTELCRGLFVTGIRQGTLNWDVLLHKGIGLALQATLCARAGDITQSRYYKKAEHLQWKDIVLKVKLCTDADKNPGLQVLRGTPARPAGAHSERARSSSAVPPPSDTPPQSTLDLITLKARITLRATKGYRNDPTKTHILTVGSRHGLDDPDLNVGDPLKLLLAQAMR